MARTMKIQIKANAEALEDFRQTFKAVEAGRRVRRRGGIYFTSIEAARNLLTPNRLALLRTIRARHPGSIYELAKIVQRDLKNVQDDLRLLARYELVRMGAGRGTGNRKVKIPTAPFDQIALEIAI
jgi:predicted transcriptional regulator